MKQVMDRETAEHFYAWLERTIVEHDQHRVEQGIMALLRDDPELVNRGWAVLWDRAEVAGLCVA